MPDDKLSPEDMQALQATLQQLKGANDPRAAKLEAYIGTLPKEEKGFWASTKQNLSNVVHLPGQVYDAFTKPAQNDQEQAASMMPVGGQTLPPSIALGMHRLIVAPMMAEADKAKQLHEQAKTETPEKANNIFSGTEHMANMHQLASMFPVLGPVAAGITEKYLQGDKGGAVADLAFNAAGPKVAEGAVKLAGKAATPLAKTFYQSALKPSTTLSTAARSSMIDTGLKSGIPVSEAGAEKLSGLITDLSSKVKAEIQAGAKAGQTVDPAAIAQRADQVKARFSNQVNPTSDLQAIDAAKQDFLQNNPKPIPVDEAQALKQGTYQQLKGRAYGELKSATVEAQKALARGIKEELEQQFPEIKGMNAQEAKLIGLDSALERALNRIKNHQLVGIGTPIVAGAVGGTAGGPAGIAAGIMKAVVDDPIVKSKLAIALNRAGKGAIPVGAATGRVSRYSALLSQSQPKEEEK